MQWLRSVFALVLLLSIAKSQEHGSNEGSPSPLLEFSESFKKTMPCGDRALKVPVLSPFEPEDVVFRVQLLQWIQAECNFKFIRIDGLQNYKVRKFDLQIFRLQADYEVFFESITMQAIYGVSGKLTNLAETRNGSLNIKLHGLTVAGTIRIGTNGLKLELRSLSVKPSVQSIESNIENVFANSLYNTIFNKVIETTVPPMLEYFQQPISDAMEAALKPTINKVLENLSLMDIIAGRRMSVFSSCSDSF